MKNPKKLKGRVNISRLSGGGTPDHMRITVIDGLSRVHFLECDMSMEDFALAITGRGDLECEFVLNSPHLAGTRHEHDTKIVPFDCYQTGARDNEAAITAALKPFEKDGWMGRRSDLTNPHNRADNGQKVSFFRYVDAKSGKPVAP